MGLGDIPLTMNYFPLHRSTGYMSFTLTTEISVSQVTFDMILLKALVETGFLSLIPVTRKPRLGRMLMVCFVTYSWQGAELRTEPRYLSY